MVKPAPKPAASVFEDDFLVRTCYARIKAGYETQGAIAVDMGMEQSKYATYESRGPLPHELIPQFCLLCRRPIEWLYAASVTPEMVEFIAKYKRPRPKRTA